MNQVKKAIGLMSGTSMDGIDVAYMETDGQNQVYCGATATFPYLAEFRNKLKNILGGQGPVAEVEIELTHLHVRAVSEFLRQINKGPTAIDVIGFHGHTIAHAPTGNPAAPGKTWQIGDGHSLAQQTGISVIAGLRYADVAAGGQGAPLVPVFHRALVNGKEKPLAVLNIGGVANVTWVGEGQDLSGKDLLAFDTGPGNALIDDWALHHTGMPLDKDGTLAAKGKVNPGILTILLDHPYFKAASPKSLDRNAFDALSVVANLSVEDGAATLTAFTIESIVLAAAAFPKAAKQWIVGGGGRRNPVLMQGLRQRLNVPVISADDAGWNGDGLEAHAWGYLAVRSLAGQPLSFPTTTGVSAPCKGGELFKP